jgi:hypothetical protein
MTNQSQGQLPTNVPLHWQVSVSSNSSDVRQVYNFPYACTIDSFGNLENLQKYPGDSPFANGLQKVQVFSAQQLGSSRPEKEFSGVTSNPVYGVISLSLCWHASPPGAVAGAYLTAAFPQTQGPLNLSVSQNLTVGPPSSNGLVGWTPQSGNLPNDITAEQWTWRATVTAGSTDPNLIYASNVSLLQRETTNDFFPAFCWE